LGECFFWYPLTQVVPEKTQTAVKWLCVCVVNRQNQATGHATQHTWCLSQSRINSEGCDRKGIQHENGGDYGDGGTDTLDEVASSPIISASASVISSLYHKTKKMACNVGY